MTTSEPRTVGVLIVDDLGPSRESLTKKLTLFGFHTAAVGSVDEALTLLSQDAGFDLVLADEHMPMRGGLDLLSVLRTDPRFYPKTEEELLREASWISKRFDAIAHQWFGQMPRRRFGITPMPAATAPFSTYALGGPGYLCAALPCRCSFRKQWQST